MNHFDRGKRLEQKCLMSSASGRDSTCLTQEKDIKHSTDTVALEEMVKKGKNSAEG